MDGLKEKVNIFKKSHEQLIVYDSIINNILVKLKRDDPDSCSLRLECVGFAGKMLLAYLEYTAENINPPSYTGELEKIICTNPQLYLFCVLLTRIMANFSHPDKIDVMNRVWKIIKNNFYDPIISLDEEIIKHGLKVIDGKSPNPDYIDYINRMTNTECENVYTEVKSCMQEVDKILSHGYWPRGHRMAGKFATESIWGNKENE